ncbi:MAG: MFS transporter [Cyclobacteriaceae bacterium]|jgi:maltose/moltooligosaccharide transporter|nr:MFS transporter [Cytophagales bacterium]MCZ8326889.1 MFS transporter [Cyclobacteriaceae bacterium]
MPTPTLPLENKSGTTSRSKLNFWQIWNMSFGFFGIQFGFALQNGNASRILQTFGADVEHLSWFWLAAPLTGMIVQPIIGYYSDRTWTSLGRRRPYFLAGAIIASTALMLMPNAQFLATVLPPLYIGAGILMVMDASFNIAMEPFRALVADLLPSDQRTLGFSIQTFLIGLGAVIGSWLPYIFAEWWGVSKMSVNGEVPYNVTLSFYIGAVVFLISILVTVITTREFPPDEYRKEDYKKTPSGKKGLSQIISDFAGMPKTMKQLGLVQFFSWFALFSMWVFTTPAVATHVYGLPLGDTSSETYQDAGNWVGIIFGVYNGVSAIYALFLPAIALKIGRKMTHAISLLAGGIGLISIYFIHDPTLLIFSMIGVGMAWASILAMPYAMLAGAIPSNKMGIYMGVFNFFITLPQIINGLVGGPIVKHVYQSQAIYSIIIAGVFMLIAAFCVKFVDDQDDVVQA